MYKIIPIPKYPFHNNQNVLGYYDKNKPINEDNNELLRFNPFRYMTPITAITMQQNILATSPDHFNIVSNEVKQTIKISWDVLSPSLYNSSWYPVKDLKSLLKTRYVILTTCPDDYTLNEFDTYKDTYFFYVSNATARGGYVELDLEIDVFQTYFNDIFKRQSTHLIERYHLKRYTKEFLNDEWEFSTGNHFRFLKDPLMQLPSMDIARFKVGCHLGLSQPSSGRKGNHNEWYYIFYQNDHTTPQPLENLTLDENGIPLNYNIYVIPVFKFVFGDVELPTTFIDKVRSDPKTLKIIRSHIPPFTSIDTRYYTDPNWANIFETWFDSPTNKDLMIIDSDIAINNDRQYMIRDNIRVDRITDHPYFNSYSIAGWVMMLVNNKPLEVKMSLYALDPSMSSSGDMISRTPINLGDVVGATWIDNVDGFDTSSVYSEVYNPLKPNYDPTLIAHTTLKIGWQNNPMMEYTLRDLFLDDGSFITFFSGNYEIYLAGKLYLDPMYCKTELYFKSITDSTTSAFKNSLLIYQEREHIVALDNTPYVDDLITDKYNDYVQQNENAIKSREKQWKFEQATAIVGGAISMGGAIATQNPMAGIQAGYNTIKNVYGVQLEKEMFQSKLMDMQRLPQDFSWGEGNKNHKKEKLNILPTLVISSPARERFDIYKYKNSTTIKKDLLNITNQHYFKYINLKNIFGYPSVETKDQLEKCVTRAYWNYIKTSNASESFAGILKTIPHHHFEIIVNALDSGVTLWNYNNQPTYDYTYNNAQNIELPENEGA